MLGDAVLATRMASMMLDEGVYVVGFSYPVVPKGKARIRVPTICRPFARGYRHGHERFCQGAGCLYGVRCVREAPHDFNFFHLFPVLGRGFVVAQGFVAVGAPVVVVRVVGIEFHGFVEVL